MTAEAIAGFPGGVDNRQMMVDAKLRTLLSSPIVIDNGTTAGLVKVVAPPSTRDRAIDRVFHITDGVAVSDHATGTIKVGTAADDDAVVASANVRNIAANVTTELTKASTLVQAGSQYAWAKGRPILPAGTALLATLTAMASGGTGTVKVGVEFWNNDLTTE